MKPIKVIHILKRLESIDRDLIELRELKYKISRDRLYYSDLVIAFELQINKLLNERVKLMELKIDNPPEYLQKRQWEKDIQNAYPLPNREDLKIPDVDGPKLTQDEADVAIKKIKAKLNRKRNPTLTIKNIPTIKQSPSFLNDDKPEEEILMEEISIKTSSKSRKNRENKNNDNDDSTLYRI